MELDSSTSEREEELQDGKNSKSLASVPPLTSLDLIKNYLPKLQSAREKITDMMEDMVVRGLRDLVSFIERRNEISTLSNSYVVMLSPLFELTGDAFLDLNTSLPPLQPGHSLQLYSLLHSKLHTI